MDVRQRWKVFINEDIHPSLLVDSVPFIAQIQQLIHENHLFLDDEVSSLFHHFVTQEFQMYSVKLIFQN